MTTVDPFTQTAPPTTNPFINPTRGGNFPKPGELLHKLLIMAPTGVDKVPDRNDPSKTRDRWSINTTVLEEDGSFETYEDMFWSQAPIARAASKAFREKRPMLGTLHIFPVQNTLKKYTTEPELLADESIKFWLSRNEGLPPTAVAWALEPANPQELERAIAWWNENMNPF
jgi:hypothetical protein